MIFCIETVYVISDCLLKTKDAIFLNYTEKDGILFYATKQLLNE